MTRVPALLLPLAACNPPNPYSFSGSPVWELFPFDGERTWDYTSTDETLSYKLIAQSLLEPEVIGNKNVYTVDYVVECVRNDPDCVDGEVLRQLRWSSTVTDGVFIHGYSVGGGNLVELSPPVQVAKDVQKRDEFVETATGGATWTSTMIGTEACPIAMNANWDECGLFEIAVDVGDGYPIAGKYWATKGNGIAAFEIATETGQWQLSDLSCDGECDGDW